MLDAPGDAMADAGAVGQEADAGALPAPPERGRKLQLMDVDTAKAILAEPYDEVAEADRPIPPDVGRDESGAAVPLPGVLSVFLTGSTLELLGCAGAGPVIELSKEAILKDINFRGAISDFHAYKQAILDSDCDPLTMRANVTDRYGDGNNFEVAVKVAAMSVWQAAGVEVARREARDAKVAQRRLAEKSLPAGKRQHKVLAPLFHLTSSVTAAA